jgi:uncharacterized membrane protein
MTKIHWIIACLLPVAALGLTAAVYPSLPERIPTHWNAAGEIDGWGPKSMAFVMPGVMIFMLGLLRAVPWLSPKHFEVDAFRGTYAFIVVLVVAFFGFIHVLALLPPLGFHVVFNKMIMSAMMLLFMLLGNVLGKVQRNFFVGVRTPWTLASERVWTETHRLAAWVFVGVGILGLIATLLDLSIFVPIVLFLAGVIAIVGFSLVRYKQLERRGQL